jgi:signal transduction histidine kinase
MPGISLRAKVLLAYVAGATLTILLLALAAALLVSAQGDVLSGLDVAQLTDDLAAMVRFDRAGRPIGLDGGEDDFASWLYDSLRREAAYRVLDAAGEVALTSAAGAAFWPTSGPATRLERGRFEFEHEGVAMRAATASIEHEGRRWYLQGAVSARFLELGYRAFALPFTGAGITLFSLLLLFVFGACAFVTLRYALAPLHRISESAAAIAPHSLGARLRADGVPTEIDPLVQSFNRALERIEKGYRAQQEFLATAAHELKTPLALLRAQIELAPDSEDRRWLLHEVERMARQVQQLLLLAEASEVHGYQFSIVDVGKVVREAAAYLARKAEAADVTLATLGAVTGPLWPADRGALFTLLKNLLENAIEHAPRGTEVRVLADETSLAVRDRGPGVATEDLERIFSRFWRGADRRDRGAGLGLAICQEIARAHGSTLTVQRAEPGLLFSLSRPKVPTT